MVLGFDRFMEMGKRTLQDSSVSCLVTLKLHQANKSGNPVIQGGHDLWSIRPVRLKTMSWSVISAVFTTNYLGNGLTLKYMWSYAWSFAVTYTLFVQTNPNSFILAFVIAYLLIQSCQVCALLHRYFKAYVTLGNGSGHFPFWKPGQISVVNRWEHRPHI